jgi:hypothetical protein
MEQREFDKKPYKYDIQLRKLEEYIKTLSPDQSLIMQNIFKFTTYKNQEEESATRTKNTKKSKP